MSSSKYICYYQESGGEHANDEASAEEHANDELSEQEDQDTTTKVIEGAGTYCIEN